MGDFQPVRDELNDITDKIPSGPLGALGRGNGLGIAGFLAVESGEIITIPIPGVQRPGFKKVSHGAEVVEPGLQRHTIVIHALSQDVAEFVTQYDASPSNFDFVRGKTKVVEIEQMDVDSTYDTYEIVVEVDRRAIRDKIDG